MKSENTMTHEETQLKVHEIINDQMKNESLYIWTWIVIWNESSFNISCQFVMILEKQSDQQTSVTVIIHNYWKWRRLILC